MEPKKHKLAFSTRSKIIHFNETRPKFFFKRGKTKKKIEKEKIKIKYRRLNLEFKKKIATECDY